MEEQLKNLTIQPPKIQYPRRPGVGNLGKKVLIRANYVKITKFPNLKLYRYNYEVVPAAKGRKPTQASRNVRGKVLLAMVKAGKFGGYTLVYDWNDLIYCSKELPMGNSRDGTKFEFSLPPNEEDGHTRPTMFNVTIKNGREINMQVLENYITSGTEPDNDDDDDAQTCMTALNTFLNFKVRTSFLSVGRGVYPPVDDGKRIMLGTGHELRKGFRQSLRIGWDGLLVNVDTSSAVLYPPGNILDVIAGFFGCRRDDLKNGLNGEDDRKFLVKILKGVRVSVTHRGDKRRKFTIDNLTTESAEKLKFMNQDQKEVTIAKYFKDTYNKTLEFGKLPCIVVKQKCYLPLEVCEVLPDQPFKGNFDDEVRAEMIKFTCVKPVERFRTIDDSFRNFFHYDQNEHLKSIGMNIDINAKVKLESRILPPTSLTFHKDSKQPTHVVDGGRWNYVNRKVLEGQTLVNWSVMVLSNDYPDVVSGFMRKFRETLNNKGMNIVNNPTVMKYNYQRNIKDGLVQAVQKAIIDKKGPPQLVVVVMKERSSIYNDIKRIAETDMGVRTQCMLSRHLRKAQEQYCVNLGLKINAKLGGKNFSLSPGQIDFISQVPTMVFGADVFHSGRTEQSVPSIAAVCASMDPAATIYSGRHSVNEKPRNETIENLEGMVVDLLKAFQSRNKRLPQRILFYRDGVSEGQFKKVIREEVAAMRRAFKRGYGDKPPKLTFVIVQKRHNTRFVPDVPQRDGDRNGNCKPGTVIDTAIVAKHEFDFFLQAHASLQGTARSAHYRVLVDENGFDANSMQSLTNKLCYLNARCTSAISIVTPAYYAHLIANRAKHYLVWDGKSSSEGSYSCPNLKKGIEDIMYFI